MTEENHVPDAAADLARTFEGLRLEPYLDVAGFPTVGYGHLLSRDKSKGLSGFAPITREEAESYLAEDLSKAARSVRRLCPVPLSDGQRAALIDFAFNLGGGALQASTLRRRVNEGEFEDVPRQLMRWVHAGGRTLPGLVRRRAAEAEIFTVS